MKYPLMWRLQVKYMSDISENHYCAGWLVDLEYHLWDILSGKTREFGLGTVSDEVVADLKELVSVTGIWPRHKCKIEMSFNPDGLVEDQYDWYEFIPIAEWEARLMEERL